SLTRPGGHLAEDRHRECRPGRERESMGSRGILSARDRQQVHRVIGTAQPTQDVAVHRGKLQESGILQTHCHSDDPQRSVTAETKMRIMTRLFFASLGLAADACCSYVWSSTTGGATSGTFNVSLSGMAPGKR